MIDISQLENQVQTVYNFQDLVRTPFRGQVNALCWNRELKGDFSEIVEKVQFEGKMTTIDRGELLALQLTESGELARNVLLDDMELLTAYGGAPILNVIQHYERDDSFPFFPTDVYSYHVDRSPIPADTFLCTYHGEASEILANSQATQKVLIPEIRAELKKLHNEGEAGFDTFLSEYFFDLHYQANLDAQPLDLGIGHIWRLAIDHPESPVPPCIHRAPEETSGRKRLLMIC